ncbi:hypothetical protein PybrP1_005789 [[Pythium] brassicae (nom. inval.)]|nr:hypothetical protein PybrP1_005789 [[Pythium] brassicae (nom. inval.)]
MIVEPSPELDDALDTTPVKLPVAKSPKHLRRATTIAVPLASRPRNASSDSTALSGDGSGLSPAAAAARASPRALVRSQSLPQRAAAVNAIENREVRFRFSTAASAREAVREMYSFRLREFPAECCHSAPGLVQLGPAWRHMRLAISRDGLTCARTSVFRKKTKEIHIPHDDILGASLVVADTDDVNTDDVNTTTAATAASTELVVHFMSPGRGQHDKKLMRQYRTVTLRLATRADAVQWQQALQTIVKWQARVPVGAARRIKVVVNPRSGKRRGRQIFQRWQPLLALAGIECDMEETQYSGHARDIGAALDLRAKYEALVFVGGDGTVNEFMNGIFSRAESEWRNLVATTPVSLLCAGTDNAFGLGVGTPTHESAVYCIIKRKIRPLDVLTCAGPGADGAMHREYACCGVSYGIGGDIAMESEKLRWLGVYRYMYLKVKRGVLRPRPHAAKLKYVLSDTTAVDPATGEQVLRSYYDVADETAVDQHHIEMCSVYDESYRHKQWSGDSGSIFDPASEARYGDQWRTEEHRYATVGASNVYFETKYAHPSDGNMDLIIARKGSAADQFEIMWRYLAGSYLKSALVDYFKVKAMVIEQAVPDPINVDGEVFPGPGPFRIEVVPRLLCVLSEK